MAMATIAGLPIELGLYTALLPMAAYAVFGTSRRMSMSTTSTIAMLTGAALEEVGHKGTAQAAAAAATTLTLMVGLVLLAASLLKLGAIANFISDPVLTGFKIGLGLAIVTDQAPKILGLHYDKASFGRNVVSLVRHLPEASMATVVVGAVSLALIFLVKDLWPRLPAPLFAVIGGIAASSLLGLQNLGVAVVGHVPSGLPGFRLPDLGAMEALWPAAIGIALMSFTETIAVGRAFTDKSEPRPHPDQELRALGMANLVGSMFHTMPAGGGTSQTVVNCRAGAKSQISEFVTAGLTILVVLFLASSIGLMPQATLAAVVIATSVGLMNPRELLTIRQLRHMEFWWGLAAAVGVVLLGTLRGIVTAVILSLVALAYESCRSPVYALARKPGTNIFRQRSLDHPDDQVFPGLLLVRAEGRLFFANAQHVGDRVWRLIREVNPKVLVLDCSAIPDFEYTALRMLENGEEKLREAGIVLWLSGLTPVTLDVVRRSNLGRVLGRERMCFDLTQAVTRYHTLNLLTREKSQNA